ncbi:MAG: site-2 protease family protein [Planctomycetes bacterium]|nr:site-2 protease family protein [Planctomycetota bacterium]
MLEMLTGSSHDALHLASLAGALSSTWNIFLILLGFSVVIFFHELGHFSVAKWAGIRVQKFAIGFGPELLGFSRGETRYSLNLLPLGGYVKMLGQEDFEVDKSGELATSDDPRSFLNKPVGHRMAVVSAGVIMNLILAAVLFMIVFMVGKEEESPLIGEVVADTPASKAGLQAGDRVASINGFEISNFSEIQTAVRLAAPFEALMFDVERDGELLSKLVVPEQSEMNWLQVGIAPAFVNEIIAVSAEYTMMPGAYPKPGDVITEINGTKVDESLRLYVVASMLQGRNKPSSILVERSDPADPQKPKKQIAISISKSIAFARNGFKGDSPQDLLGLRPRVKVSRVTRKSAAAFAGLLDGDVIVRWGKYENPTPDEIRGSMLDRDGRDIPVRVLRDGQNLSEPLYYRPRIVRDREGELIARAGCKFILNEQDRIMLSGVTAEAFGKPTPAALAGLRKGCEIVAVDQQPINTWSMLAERFRELAGKTVQLTYLPPGSSEPQIAMMSVPESLSTLLDMPSYAGPFQRINFTLDGRTEILVSYGGEQDYLPAYHPLAIRYYLEQHVGEEVQVAFQDEAGVVRHESVRVTEDMVDPWYRRVVYSIPDFQFKPVAYLNRELNPFKAVWAGTMQTYYFVAKTYLTLRRLIFTRSVGVEHMSGPVGIIGIGSRVAKASKIDLLFFLALISANLAVLNFLPLPIVDGGLMVFLIIEKIKGSPVGIRTQVVTQLVGIALFATMFVLITFKDIADLIG